MIRTDSSSLFQKPARHACTICFPGMMSRFFPPIAPPCACQVPPTLRLSFAGAPVEVECFFESIYISKSVAGEAENFTRCVIVGVMGLVPECFSKLLKTVEKMAHFIFFRLEICAGSFRNAGLASHTLDHANSELFELANFFWIIRKQADFRGTKFFQDLRGKIVVALVGGES